MFEHTNGIFSKDYNEEILHRDRVRGKVLDAIEELKGFTLFGRPISTNNPEEIIAVLYLLYKDNKLFHERLV